MDHRELLPDDSLIISIYWLYCVSFLWLTLQITTKLAGSIHVSIILQPWRSGIHSQSARLRLRGSGAGAPRGSRGDPLLLLPGSASGADRDPWPLTASHRVPPFPFPCGRSAFPPHICLFSREPLWQAYLHTLRFSPAHPWSRLWVPGNRSTASSDEEVGIFGGRYSAHHIHFSFF